MKDKVQFWLDIAILIGIVLAIYYLRMQGNGDTNYGPFEGFMAMIGIGGN